jgi:putative spermidine/putrescine transport system substrate-binding protein
LLSVLLLGWLPLPETKLTGKGIRLPKIFIGAAVLSLVLVSGCGLPTPVAATPLQTVGPGEGQLDIIAWDGSIERGDVDRRYDWVTDFEKTTGCQVNVKTAASSDEMVALMNQGGFDLVTAAGDAASRLVAQGKVQPINTGLIPSWEKIDPRLKGFQWNSVNGKQYGVPFLWNVSKLMYSTEIFPTPPRSWDVLFEEQTLPDGQSNQGRVQPYEGPITIADAALFLKQTRPDLGIDNPYELTREQFGEAIRILRDQHDLVSGYWPDAASHINSFVHDGNAVSIAWPYQIAVMQRAGLPVAGVIPDGGVTGRVDSFMLHTDAAHPNCAYKWIEHALDPKVQGDAAAWTGSNPVVPQGCMASELLGTEGCHQNGYDDFEDVHFWRTPVEDCGNGQLDCVPYSEWVTAYISVIGGH